MSHDRLEEAVEVFARLEGKGTSFDHPAVVQQRDMVLASVVEETRRDSNMGRSFHRG